jgi:hypothetical protein
MPTPIRYSEAPSSYLMSLARSKRQEQLLQQKARLEDEKVQSALPMQLVEQMKSIDTDVRDRYANAYLGSLVESIRSKKYSTADLSMMAAQYANNIANVDRSIKQFKEEVDQAVKGIDKNFSVNPKNIYAASSEYILRNINDPSALGNGNEFVAKVIETRPDLVVNREAGIKTLNNIIAKSPKFTQSGVISSDRTGNMKLVSDYTAKIPFWYEMKQDKDPSTGLRVYKPSLKLDSDGLVSKDVFDQFYNYSEGPMDFRTKMTINAGANDLIIKNNIGKKPTDRGYMDPDNAGTVEVAKRLYLTNYLNNISEPDFTLKSTVDRQKPSGGGSGGGSKSVDQAYIDSYGKIYALASSVRPGMGAPVNELENTESEFIINAAKKSTGVDVNISNIYIKKTPDNRIGIYAANNDILDEAGNTVIRANQPITYLSDVGTNIKANAPLGTKAKNAAASKGKQKAAAPARSYKGIDPKTGKPIFE